jgi:hypothetical protein
MVPYWTGGYESRTQTQADKNVQFFGVDVCGHSEEDIGVVLERLSASRGLIMYSSHLVPHPRGHRHSKKKRYGADFLFSEPT